MSQYSNLVDSGSMEVIMADPDDLIEQEERTTEPPRRTVVVIVDEEHPFDLESYISQYTGRIAIQHLAHISANCPQLAGAAIKRAAQTYREQTRDVQGYFQTCQSYTQLHPEQQSGSLPIDTAWMEATEQKNIRERSKLESDLKTYTSNMIKESIRMAHRELASFNHETGNLSEALKHHAKCREFCTTSAHLIDMCLQVLEILIEQRNWAHISTYVYKAESSMEPAGTSTAAGVAARKPGGSSAPAAAAAASSSSSSMGESAREKVQAKLDLASALAYLGQGSYEKAARAFLKIKSIRALDDWAGKIIAPADIAVAGVLCALATFTRSAVKAAVLESDTFSIFIEQETYVRDMLDAYMNSKFKQVLTILDRNYAKHSLSFLLQSHLSALTSAIRSRALVLYFTPFQSVKLETMAFAFGLDVKDLEIAVVRLIKEDQIKARVDGKNKILVARAAQHGNRSEAYQKILKVGQDMQATNRKLLLRMSLVQADLVVKAPKNDRGLEKGQMDARIAMEQGALYD